jgi:DNA invertase Pin-like site-specific DNA recombinase
MDGRSLKRQEEAAKAYCERHGLTLDERTFTDLGVSGYHGADAKGGQLGSFLAMVKEGRIPKKSVLIVENIDRLSRLPPHEANEIVTAIVKAGVDIATTSPEHLYTANNIHQFDVWLPLQMAQCLAAEESRKKSDRCTDAWAALRASVGEMRLT